MSQSLRYGDSRTLYSISNPVSNIKISKHKRSNKHQRAHLVCQIFHFTFYSDTQRYVTYCH